MTTWLEPPPRRKGMGCFGKGCLLIIGLIVVGVIGLFVGGYTMTSKKPREIPVVETSSADQQAVITRWNEFKNTNQFGAIEPAQPAETAVPDESATPGPESNRIELTADDINQLIAANRKARGKAYVTIVSNEAHIQVSIPIPKIGRYFSGDFVVRPAADGDPRNLQVSQASSNPVSTQLFNMLLGRRSLHGYLNEFVSDYGVRSLIIRDNRAIIETNRRR